MADRLWADGLSTVLGGVFNTFPYTAYAQNVGLVGMTRVRSRWVVAAAGGMLVLLGLLPKLGAVVAAIPPPVLGGAGLVMFGTVAASGLRTPAEVGFRGNHNLTVVAVSVAVGALPVGVPTVYDRFPDWFQTVMHSGISAGCLTAIVLNLLFNHLPLRDRSASEAESGGLPVGGGGGGEQAVEESGKEIVQVVPAQAVHLGRSAVDLPDHTALAQYPEVVRGRGLGDRQVEVRTGELVAGAGDELAHDAQPHRVGERVQHAFQPDVLARRVRQGTGAGGRGGGCQIIINGEADAVLLGRELLRNPSWARHAARELGGEVRVPDQYHRSV
ncbi:hypothetical protein GCM10010254_18800 [Streptomyces chromofuscus]|nr:hypothetical protein GCM10010254_18800 [Streptomyces chromofuscus]